MLARSLQISIRSHADTGGFVMTNVTRRAALAGFAAASFAAPSAHAAIPTSLRAHPGFRAWTQPAQVGGLPLADMVETEAGPKRFVDWLDHRPAVVALWASWCAPCLVEKPHQADLAGRLARSGASTRILALQAFDAGYSFERGRALLDRIGARTLPSARTTPTIEDGFQRLLGSRTRGRVDTTLPTVFLIGADGLEMGRAVGMMTGPDGSTDYWQDEASFDFLSRLF